MIEMLALSQLLLARLKAEEQKTKQEKAGQ